MPTSLKYARVKATVRTLALPAFICGMCSGPVAVGLARFAVANSLPEQAKESLGLLSLAAVFGGALIFGCVARAKIPSDAPARIKRFANIAIAAPIAWCVAIFALFIYALNQI